MAMEKGKVKNPLVFYSWGIILGMSGVPLLALISKLAPAHDTIWAVLAGVCVLLVVVSLYGYVTTPALPRKKRNDPMAHAH